MREELHRAVFHALIDALAAALSAGLNVILRAIGVPEVRVDRTIRTIEGVLVIVFIALLVWLTVKYS